MKKHAVWGFILFLLTAGVIFSQGTILIKNGTVVTVSGSSLRNGCVLIRDGKIADVGKDISAPAGARIIDAGGGFIYPGMIAPFTALGLTGYPGAGNDTNETGTSTPHMDPFDAFNPEDECIEVARIDGITTALTVSGSRNALSGGALVMNLEGDLADDMVMKKHAAMVFNMGAKVSGKYPSTLPGVNALIRDKLNQAQRYADRTSRSLKKDKDAEPIARSLEMEALIPVLEKKIPAIFVTMNEVTIRGALRIIDEYDLKGILFASAGILKYADRLAAEKIPVIWSGTMTIPRRWEAYDLNYHTAAVLQEKGVLFAFNESAGGPGSRNVRRQPVPAAMSVAHGLSEDAAVKALTINPARILGISDRVGSLEKGKAANLFICSGNILQLSSKVKAVIINGKVIPMTSVQTRLRDKFAPLVRERCARK